jgi:hypothetical protein
LLDDAKRRDEHRGHGGLVVGAEDRAPCVPDHAVLDDGLDRPLRRDGVEVCAQEDRNAAAVRRREPAEEVPGARVDASAGIVLGDLQPVVAEAASDEIGDGTLAARRARDRRQLEEEAQDLRVAGISRK